MKQLAFFTLLFLVTTPFAFSQSKGKKSKTDTKLESCQEIENKTVLELLEKAGDKKKFKKEERMKFLEQALELEPDFVDANFLYANERIKTLTYDNKPFKPTEPYFKKVVLTCPKYHSDPYYFLGYIYYEEENYDSAKVYLKKYIDFSDDDDKKFNDKYDAYKYQATQMLKYAKFYSEIFKEPVPFDPNPVNGVSTKRIEKPNFFHTACDKRMESLNKGNPCGRLLTEIATKAVPHSLSITRMYILQSVKTKEAHNLTATFIIPIT